MTMPVGNEAYDVDVPPVKARGIEMSEDELVDEVFLGIVSRFPTDYEKTATVKYLKDRPDKKRQAALTDVVWALMNTNEFIFNH